MQVPARNLRHASGSVDNTFALWMGNAGGSAKKSLPIVKKQPEFMDFLGKALKKLQRLLKLKAIQSDKP